MSLQPVGPAVWNLPGFWTDRKSEEVLSEEETPIEKPLEKPEPKKPDGALNYVW